MSLIRIAGLAFVGFVGFVALVDTALAGAVAAPGPVAGIGLPALVLIWGAYGIGRKLFGHQK